MAVQSDASFNTMMGVSYGIGAIASFGSAWGAAAEQEANATFQAAMMDINSEVAKFQADDAIIMGNRAASEHLQKVRGVIGAQKAAMAAQGIEVNDNSALEVLEDTARSGAIDALIIRNNARREAWGFRVSSSQYASQAGFSRIAADYGPRGTLIGGGLDTFAKGLGAYSYYTKGRASLKSQPKDSRSSMLEGDYRTSDFG